MLKNKVKIRFIPVLGVGRAHSRQVKELKVYYTALYKNNSRDCTISSATRHCGLDPQSPICWVVLFYAFLLIDY